MNSRTMDIRYMRYSRVLLLLTLVVGWTANSAVAQTSSPVTPENAQSGFGGKLLSLMGRMQPNQEYQVCQTPAGEQGHCKYPQHCKLQDVKVNVWRVLGYLCLIEKIGIGVCCPDAGDGKVVTGPVQGDLESDGPPVWSVADSNRIDDQPPAAVFHPEERGCGLATKSIPRVTGGRPADPGEWPWMAALLRRGPPGPFCGGVLITDRHVLTAAHCTHKFRTSEIFVRLGEYDFADFNETRARDFRITDIRQHPDFDNTNYENDISLLKLERATLFNSYIWPVCMPPTSQNWEGVWAVVTGWGTQSFGGPASEVLMEVAMPVWKQERCLAAFNERVFTSVICAAGEDGQDACQGDSGGPLLAQLPNGRWVTIGIVSWGIRCGEPNYPGIYTRVDSYSDWIMENSVF